MHLKFQAQDSFIKILNVKNRLSTGIFSLKGRRK